MINVSREFRQALTEKREYRAYVDLVLSDGTEIPLSGGTGAGTDDDRIMGGGLKTEDAVSSDGSFDIGAAVINKCTVKINNMDDALSAYDFTDAEAVVRVGLALPSGRTETVRKGTYAVDEPKYNGSTIVLSCLDNMRKFDRPYSLSELIYPATLGEIVRDACSVCKVSLQTPTFPRHDFIVQERPADGATTFREVISWAAQIACCFCRCDVYGRLELKWYDVQALESASLDGGSFKPWTGGDVLDGGSFSPWTGGTVYDGGTFGDREGVHHIYSNFSVDIATDDVVITGVRVLEKTKEDDKDAMITYQNGTDGYVLSIENNDLIQGGAGQMIADRLGEQLIGLRFRPASVSHLSDPTIEAGDVGFLTDRKGRTYRIVVSNTRFAAGDSQDTSCNAQTPARNSAVRYSAATKSYVENRKNLEKERTERETALENLKERVDGSPGLFTTREIRPEGGDVFYMHDRPLLKDSKIIWIMTADAWGVSTDGGKTLNAGMTVDGDLIARILDVIGVRGEWMRTGILSVGDTGEETLYVNFHTKEVRIRPETFSLASGKTIEGIAQEAADAKRRIFTKQPSPPYDVGDLWTQGKDGDIKVCNTARASGSYNVSDWGLASKYIDQEAAKKEAKKAVDSQTPQSMVDILSRNGKDKGIWLADYDGDGENELYISFNAARGGELCLGGRNNGYGTFRLKNRYDWDVAFFDKENIIFRRIYTSPTLHGDVSAYDSYKTVFGDNGMVFYRGRVQGGEEIEDREIGSLHFYSPYYWGDNEGYAYTRVALNVVPFGRDDSAVLLQYDGETRLSAIKEGVYINPKLAVEKITRLSDVNDSYAAIILDTRNITITKKLTVEGAIVCSTGKSRLVRTEDYSDRLLYCYEMPSPMFGDIGEAVTDENGECYIFLDDIFAETITAEIEYQVFLQKEGEGDIWVDSKETAFFVVKGTPNLKFAWEIKAKQRDFEFERLEDYNAEPEEIRDFDYESEYMDEINQLMREQEELLYEKAQ